MAERLYHGAELRTSHGHGHRIQRCRVVVRRGLPTTHRGSTQPARATPKQLALESLEIGHQCHYLQAIPMLA
jgi:hypothetical protein